MVSKISKLVVFVFISLIINFSAQIVSPAYSELIQESGGEVPSLLSYNATSPVEYFNETSDPRYSLVTRPISLLLYPHKGFPAIIGFDEFFTVYVNSSSDTTNWEFFLKSGIDTVFLNILHTKYENSIWQFEVKPNLNIASLYDLQVNCSAGSDYQTHAVKIIEEKTYPFKILHLSDTHFPSYDDLNTTAVCLERIEELKVQNIDFAIFTGDLIDGGPANLFVNPVDGKPLDAEVQLKLGLWALDLLNLPIFIIGGNHDLDSTTILLDDPPVVWKQFLGQNPVLNFSYIDWSFVGFSSTKEGLTTDENNLVRSILQKEESRPNVLFYHSNYQNQPANLRSSFDIEVMLYGHEHHEELFVQQHTLYHCQAPLFYNESSVITVLGKTNLSLNEVVYDFSPLLTPSTDESSFSSILYSGILCLVIVLLYRKIRWKKTY